MNIKADILPISRLLGSQRRDGGGANLLVEIPPGKHFILEFEPEDALRLFSASVAALPPVSFVKGMATTHPVFDLADAKIGYDQSGDTALVLDFKGAGQVALGLTPELAHRLRDELSSWLTDLGSRPDRPVS